MFMAKKIIVINTRVKPTYGGEEWTTQQIAEMLDKHYDVTYIGYPFNIKCKKKVFPFTEFLVKFPIKKGLGRLMRAIPITKIFFIKKLALKCDLLITNSDYDDIVIFRGGKENIQYKKVLVVKHSANARFEKAYPDKLLKERKFSIVVLNKADGVVLSEKYGKKNISVIPTGMEFHRFPTGKLPQNWSIPTDRPTILSIGRLGEKQKGFSFGIRAIEECKKRDNRFFYVIAGEGPDRTRYEQLIKKLGLEQDVKLLGRVSDAEKYTLLKLADVVLIPSKEESLGLVMVEALNAGKVLLTTKTDGSVETIIEGRNGFFVKRDPVDIAIKLTEIFNLKGGGA